MAIIEMRFLIDSQNAAYVHELHLLRKDKSWCDTINAIIESHKTNSLAHLVIMKENNKPSKTLIIDYDPYKLLEEL